MAQPSPKDRIIFPLDVPTKNEALKYVKLLKDSVGVFKVGLELFVAEGPAIVKTIKAEAPGCKIFLDLKLHDIPETIRRAMKSAATLGSDFVTVHCDNRALLSATQEAAASGCVVLGVTVLTSLSKKDLKGQDPEDLVLERATLAKEAGLGGVVCSGLEVKRVKEKFGNDLVAVTPGIRLKDNTVKADDQKRVVTPYDAIRDGADYIVVGRPIRDSKDPVGAAAAIAEEIKRALEE